MNQKIGSSGGQNWCCIGGFWRICGGPPAKKSNRKHSPHLTSPLDWPSGSGLNFNGLDSLGGQVLLVFGRVGFELGRPGPPAKKSNTTHSPHLTSPLDWPSGSGLNFNGLDSLGGQVLLVFGRVGFELGRPGPPAKKSNITHGPKNPTELAPQAYPALWERLCLQRRFQRAAQLWGASSVRFFGSRAPNSRV